MGKLIQMKTGRAAHGRPGHRSSRSMVMSQGSRRRKRKSGFKAFVRRYIKLIAIAAGVIAVGVICLVLFLGGPKTAPAAQQTAQSTPTPPPAEDTYDYSAVDDATLAGLAGTDESLFSSDEDMAEAMFEEEGIRIGITVGSIASPDQEFILNRMEQVSSAAESDKTIFKTYYYNANGSYNQQLQDVRSLIKNSVDVIIVGFTDAESFKMISMMAQNENIPVVAFDAPMDSGYVINVVADQTAWGAVYGQFAAAQSAEGNVVQVFGKADSPVDAQRAAAIGSAIAANTALTVNAPLYADWDKKKANELMTEFLKKGKADVVITEEGMAEGILDAFVAKGVLPKVMCGDATAGFIKKWHALKNGGIDVTPPPEDDGKKKKKDETPTPTPQPVMFTAQPGEFIVCAQPAPSGIGAAAFDIAVEMAKGRTLIASGQTFTYTVSTMITEANLNEFYELVKDQKDTYIISDVLTDDVLNKLLNPLEQQPESTATPVPAATPSATPAVSTPAAPGASLSVTPAP